MTDLTVVTGAGGFIGGHLVARLIDEGRNVRAVDVKPIRDWWQVHTQASNFGRVNVGSERSARAMCSGATEVYNLAADMGGMGFIEHNKLDCMLSVLPSTQMLCASALTGVQRFFYSSSACVYPAYRQEVPDVVPLREDDAYPAEAEDGYGWEKLFTERMCRHFSEETGLETRVGRYHNVFGPHGTWTGGREKAPAALCRKVAVAKLTGTPDVEIWGDGLATRTFMYVNDCVEGTLRIMACDHRDPVNVGSSELVTVNELAQMIMDIADLQVPLRHVDGPQGVRGRSSDNTLMRERYSWEPEIKLWDGLEATYAWVYDRVKETM